MLTSCKGGKSQTGFGVFWRYAQNLDHGEGVVKDVRNSHEA
jgi:hypothetical protein